MGMYSYFDDEDIKVTDWDGLLKFLVLWKKEFPESWIGIKPSKDDTRDFSMVVQDKVYDNDGKETGKTETTFTFRNWDDIKLISYWYDETCYFLKCIAKFIEGEVRWSFESDDEGGSVSFEDGICTVTTGVMSWTDWNVKDNIHKDVHKEAIDSFIFLSNI